MRHEFSVIHIAGCLGQRGPLLSDLCFGILKTVLLHVRALKAQLTVRWLLVAMERAGGMTRTHCTLEATRKSNLGLLQAGLILQEPRPLVNSFYPASSESHHGRALFTGPSQTQSSVRMVVSRETTGKLEEVRQGSHEKSRVPKIEAH